MSTRPPQFQIPPPPQVRPNLTRTKRGGGGMFSTMWGGLSGKDKISIIGSILGLLAIVCGFYYWWGAAMGRGAPPPEPTAEVAAAPIRVTVDLSQNPVQQTAITETESIEEVNPPPGDEEVLEWPTPDMAAPNFSTRILIGNIRMDKEFGYCEVSNIGFSAGGQPYFLWIRIDDLPDVDLSRTQLQIEGVLIAAPRPCNHPMLKVVKVNVAAGQIEPVNYLLATETPSLSNTQYITKSDGTTATVTPMPVEVISKQEYLQSVPLRDQNGTVVATAVSSTTRSSQPATTPQMVNLYGTLSTISCSLSNFSVVTSGGEYVLLFGEGSALPAVNKVMSTTITVVGEPIQVCGRSGIKVKAITYADTVAPTPTATPAPTATPNPTSTPRPTATPPILTLAGRLITNAQGCSLTSFGMYSNNGVFLLFVY